MKKSETLEYEKKFIDSILVEDYEVLTDSGYVDIVSINKTVPYTIWKIETLNYNLECADTHIIFDENMEEVFVKDLHIGDSIQTETGLEKILSISTSDIEDNMYDLQLTEQSNKRYYTNGILSHNTTLYTVYVLWYAMFHKDKTLLIIANKFNTAKEILERIQLAYELMPSWLKLGCDEYNKSRMVFENGSKIVISSTSPSACRGFSADILIIDEAAHIPEKLMVELVQSVLPIVSSRPDSQIIAVSTPNGTGNWYSDTYHKALYDIDVNGWKPFRIDWWDRPGRDEAWKNNQLATLNYDYRRFAQEFGNNFLGSSQTLINSKIIEHYKKVSETYNDPEEFSMQNWFAKVWYKPRKDRTYVIGCDIGEGVGGDYSIALVLDITDTARIKICATFSNNTISPTDFAYVLAKLSKKYNNAIIAGERNGIGRSTMDTIWNVYEMENILCWKGKGEAMLNPGIFSHNSIKVQACIWAKFIIDSQDLFDIEFNDKNILFEMEYFEKKANTTYSVYKAVEGKHDDYMMSLIWGLWLIEPTVAEFNFIVESVTTTKTGIPVPRIIKADNIMMDDYYNEPDEYKSSDDSSIDIDNIYSKMSGSKTKREVKEDVEFSLDDEVGFLDDIDETFDEDEFNEFGEYSESWM